MTVIILDWDFMHYFRRVDERYLTLDEAIEQVEGHERQNKAIKAQIANKAKARVANKAKALVANKAIKALVAEPRSDEELKETLTDLRDNTAELNRIKRHLHTLINLSLIHISEPTRRTPISYAVFCLKKKKKNKKKKK